MKSVDLIDADAELIVRAVAHYRDFHEGQSKRCSMRQSYRTAMAAEAERLDGLRRKLMGQLGKVAA